MAEPEANGTLLARGDASFPGGASLRFAPLLAMLNESGHLRALSIQARNVTLRYFEDPYTAIGTVHLLSNPSQSIYHMREASLELEGGDQGGYLAFLPPMPGDATFTATTSFMLHPRDRTEVATSAQVGVEDEADDPRMAPHHQQSLREPHLLFEAPGMLAYVGPGEMKLHGPNLQIAWDGRRASFPTGLEAQETTLRHGVRRWAVLQFEDARIQMDSASPWLLALSGAQTHWDGRVGLHPVSGSVAVDGQAFQATGIPAWLEGRLSADLSIERDAHASLLARWDVWGTLTSTTLRAQASAQVPVAGPASRFPWAWLLMGMVAAGGGSAYVATVLGRRRHVARPASLDDCLDAANAAAAHEDWAEAAEWFSRARRWAPTSARLCGDLAFALEQMGDAEGALRLYEEGARLSSDGEADFNGAFTALRAGRSPAEVAAWLARALERSPELAVDLEDDEALGPVRGEPAFEVAMARAWRRLPEEK